MKIIIILVLTVINIVMAQKVPEWLRESKVVVGDLNQTMAVKGVGVHPPPLPPKKSKKTENQLTEKQLTENQLTEKQLTENQLTEIKKRLEELEKKKEEKEERRYTYHVQICTFDYQRLIGMKINPFEAKIEDILLGLTEEERLTSCYSAKTRSGEYLDYAYGLEKRVQTGYIYDNFGNKLETSEKELIGIDLMVRGDSVAVRYTENKLVTLESEMDQGRTEFRSEFVTQKKDCWLWVLCDYEDQRQLVTTTIRRD